MAFGTVTRCPDQDVVGWTGIQLTYSLFVLDNRLKDIHNSFSQNFCSRICFETILAFVKVVFVVIGINNLRCFRGYFRFGDLQYQTGNVGNNKCDKVHLGSWSWLQVLTVFIYHKIMRQSSKWMHFNPYVRCIIDIRCILHMISKRRECFSKRICHLHV